ncbi:MAG TPA: sodium:solute symporter family protein [Planctomycetaceae bacterium]|nr:sodium:solute symporter family protein [Planctomycetaceae bacterium]
MAPIDYVVLVVYFLGMAGIGVWSMGKVKRQEDFFLGGRSFGKLLQAFAVFGAGTGAHEPVLVGRTTYTSGLSGIWSVFQWLFLTPFYWFFAVWYRRMRHVTLADWFVERYQSRALGAAFVLYGIAFYMYFLALGFSAVGKMCVPLIGVERLWLPWWDEAVPIDFVLVPVIAVVVMIYGVLGGLRAAYWTDLVQGVCIILLSVLLIPAGLQGLVERYGAVGQSGALAGLEVMHQRVPAEYFRIFQTPRGGEFPLHFIVALTLLALVGIVVQPHFITIGGGSARTELAARVGLVGGVLMKRLCSVAWALTALIVLALMADNAEIAEDPDRVWGVAARELLGPYRLGLVGLMLACLVAALMSSADCYMLVVSALVVRNIYAAYLNRRAGERECILAGRLVGVLIITGGVVVALCFRNIFEQLIIALELPILFAAPFWMGIFWRRATPLAAWLTVAFSAVVFFAIPAALPRLTPSLAQNPRFTVTNDVVTTITRRLAAPADVARRDAEIALWEKAARQRRGPDGAASARPSQPRPQPIRLGEPVEDRFSTGGKPIYFKGRIEVLGPDGRWHTPGPEHLMEIERRERAGTVVIRQRYRPDHTYRGIGRFNLDFVLYEWLGIDLRKRSNAALETLRLPTRLVLPFLVMVAASLLSRPADPEPLDRYYAKMRTPVDPDPQQDGARVAEACRGRRPAGSQRLVRRFGLEIQKPTLLDIAGFVAAFVLCFGIIGLTVWLANLGAGPNG